MKPALSICALLLICWAAPAWAADQPASAPVTEAKTPKKYVRQPLRVDGFLTFQYIENTNTDLGTGARENTHALSVQPRVRVAGWLNDIIYGYFDVRAVEQTGDAGSEDTDAQIAASRDFVELRQAALRFNYFLGLKRTNLEVGRQRIAEPRSLWWGRNFDAVRVNYKTDAFKGFIGFGENLFSYRTSHDDLNEDDQKRFRAFAEGSWQWRPDHYVEGRALYENDHSGTQHIGDLVDAGDYDAEDADLVWIGARSHGIAQLLQGRKVSYRFDALGVAGTESVLTLGPATGGVRSVTGRADRDVMGWAMDTSVDVPLTTGQRSPTFTLGYAFGSGDDNPAGGTDHAFRQSGLHGNAGYQGSSGGYFRNYGEVLRPELSNLHILTAGAGVPLSEASDINLFYHYYRLDEAATALRSSAIAAPLNGSDKYLGQGADLVFNTGLLEETGAKINHLKKADLKILLSAFRSGDAYGAAEGENSFRAFTQIMFRF